MVNGSDPLHYRYFNLDTKQFTASERELKEAFRGVMTAYQRTMNIRGVCYMIVGSNFFEEATAITELRRASNAAE